MLDVKDLELILSELSLSETELNEEDEKRVESIIKRLHILIDQDKANTEYRTKMEEYSKQLKELVESLEK